MDPAWNIDWSCVMLTVKVVFHIMLCVMSTWRWLYNRNILWNWLYYCWIEVHVMVYIVHMLILMNRMQCYKE
jgi:hypothetical protein